MKLSKLYANQPQFKTITFNSGFNVIYGDVANKELSVEEVEVEVHNLGKTSLVHLINFMLLEKIDKTHYLSAYKEKFLNWEFFLEVKLNDGSYVTIKRTIDDPAKVSFKRHYFSDQDYTYEKNWDYSEMSLYSQKDEENAESIFTNQYLKFDINQNYSFRFFLGYALRTQDDYLDVFHLNKFKGKDMYWKPQLFDLLGFNPKLLDEKYDVDDQISLTNKLIRRTKPADEEDKYEILAAIQAKEQEKLEAQADIDQFNFYAQDNEVNTDLVKDIEQQISILNSKKYNISSEIEQIQQSLEDEQPQSIEVKDLEQFFEEISVVFPNDLKREYSEVLSFSRQLSDERQKYLRTELKDQQSHLRNANNQLRDLNLQRAKLLSILTEKDSFAKFKEYQNRLSNIENQIFDYKQQLRDLSLVQVLDDEQKARKAKLDTLVAMIDNEIIEDPNDFIKIKKMFMDIYKSVFEYTATLVVKLNKDKNIEFQPNVLSGNVGENSSGKSKGYTSRKVMCAAFILSILTTYSDRSFIRFAYTDGILEGWGDNHKPIFIRTLRDLAEEYDIQFIISVINSDLPRDFTFKDGEIVRTLSKKDTLFNNDF